MIYHRLQGSEVGLGGGEAILEVSHGRTGSRALSQQFNLLGMSASRFVLRSLGLGQARV
jgi:hypothetical protein